MSGRRRWAGIAGSSALLAYMATMMAIAHFLLARILATLRVALPPVASQVVGSLFGLAIFVVSIGVAITVSGRGDQLGSNPLFRAFVEALEQIARGNFDVRVERELTPHERKHFGGLVDSLNSMAEKLGQLEAMRQEFISDVSHEIQSPLTSILGFARALRNEGLTAAERHHYLDIIETESKRLSRVTEHLLRLAALESDQVPFDPKEFRLDRQIRELVLACEPQWAPKRLDVEVELAEVPVVADEDLLSQVWINLMHNAIKFTPEGGTLRLELKREGAEARFAIADSGVGIAEADQPRIFERFFKADRARSREGSGFGLAIARRILDLHQGTIRVESTPGAGATFHVMLPTVSLNRVSRAG